MNGDVHTYWQLQDLDTGLFSKEIFETEEEAALRAARLNQGGKAGWMGNLYAVVSFEERED